MCRVPRIFSHADLTSSFKYLIGIPELLYIITYHYMLKSFHTHRQKGISFIQSTERQREEARFERRGKARDNMILIGL